MRRAVGGSHLRGAAARSDESVKTRVALRSGQDEPLDRVGEALVLVGRGDAAGGFLDLHGQVARPASRRVWADATTSKHTADRHDRHADAAFCWLFSSP